MNMERNRFEYGHIIDQNTFEQTAEEIKREVCEKINFKNGILRDGSMSILWAQKVELFSQHNICRENYFLGC